VYYTSIFTVMASTSTCDRVLRKDYEVWLVGHIASAITGHKLPSNRQVLAVFFFNLRVVKKNSKESAELAVKETVIFWDKSRIPTRRSDHCVEKLLKLYDEWKNLQKSSKKKSEMAKNCRQLFIDKLDNIFDIAHEDALKTALKEDADFLILQRQKGRPGYFSGIDVNFVHFERRKEDRIQKEMERRKRVYSEMAAEEEKAEYQSSSLSSEEEEDETGCTTKSDVTVEEKCLDSNDFESIKMKPQPTVSRGAKDFFTPELAEVLDRCQISDRNAMRIIVAVVKALQYDITAFILNRTSIRRRRSEFREKRYREIKEKFTLSEYAAVVVHWDGKLLPTIQGKKVDRLAVLVTFDRKEQLLGVPEIPNSCGKEQASAVHDTITKWNIAEKVQALCFDTTASNTGDREGACQYLEKKIKRTLLYLPCRHHIYELVLKSAFDAYMGVTSGPDVLLFKRFKEIWNTFDTTKYCTSLSIPKVREMVDDVRGVMLEFLTKKLEEEHARDDYRELLELSVIFLGNVPPHGVKFRFPGPISHARWMAKAIYVLKIFLFKQQFKLNKNEEKLVQNMSVFIIRAYVKAWFESTIAPKAPYNDLNFLKTLIQYEEIDSHISKATVKKFIRHLWYLSSEAAALAFFDENISIKEKRMMAKKIMEDEGSAESSSDDDDELFQNFEDEAVRDEVPKTVKEKKTLKKYFLKNTLTELEVFVEKNIYDFITPQSKELFKRFGIQTSFLMNCPSTWANDENFQRGLHIVKNLSVVNDVAERGVKLISEYQNILSNDENEKQYILQIVQEHRKLFPNVCKSSLGASI
jgi:hypothetical protein